MSMFVFRDEKYSFSHSHGSVEDGSLRYLFPYLSGAFFHGTMIMGGRVLSKRNDWELRKLNCCHLAIR